MQTFDYIIVGAGSAGCVLAERLSANGRHSVLLLEAGGTDRRLFVQMPLGYGKLYHDPAVNWLYRTEPDPGLGGQRDHWPRGKVVGGSSSINAMVWIRGHPQDYQDWEAAGNPGWGWAAVGAAFREIEAVEGGGPGRGTDGPLRILRDRPDPPPLLPEFLAAAEAAGLPRNADFNGGDQEGVGPYELTVRGGRRNSAARAFLRPALRRRNVTLRTHAQVTRVLFDGRRATGVAYLHRGALHEARAGREVILAGGAINTPQLLQLSGIGPAGLLRDHAIEVRHANDQVGANLTDHQGLNYTWRMRVPTLNERLRPWWGKLDVGLRWLLARRGPLAQSINHGGGFFRSSPDEPRPDMQLYMQAFSTLIPRDGERPVLTPDPFPGLSLGLSNCRPTSRGHIRIASADPLAHPCITANALSSNSDIARMLAGVKLLRRIAAEAPLAALVAEELRPGPDCTGDDDLVADIRARAGTVYHPCSTARMGPDPATSVVDAALRVHGIGGLRVADASVFPNIVSGNTNAAAIMVGWQGAALILRDAG